MGVVGSGAHALARLIDAVAEAHRYSDEDIAKRARARGHHLSKSNISRIRNEPVKSVNAAQMNALADGLGLPVSTVLQAALTSMGLPTGGARNRFEDVVKADPNLLPEARAHLLVQYALLLRIATDQPAALRQTEVADADLDAQMDQVIDDTLDSDPVPPTPIRGGKPRRK
jgi:hypothetical protein